MLKNKKHYGLTLIEVIVSITIFAAVVLASTTFFSYGHRHSTDARKMDFAMEVASGEIDRVLMSDYDNVVTNPGSTDYNQMGTQFRMWMASSQLHTYEETYKVVTVSVTWTSASGLAKDVKLFTVVSPED